MGQAYWLDTSLARETAAALDAFTFAYIEAAFWTATDEDGEPMGHLGLHDLSPEALQEAIRDCRAFQETYAEQLASLDAAQSGHDFLLTRNGHGAGFWDRGYPDAIADPLTEGAGAYGTADLYLGDDGLLYFHG